MSSIEISAQIVVCNSFDEISNFIGEKISNMDCRKIVQAYPYWGCDSNLAGGKDVIAGSPRDHKYDEKDLEKFVNWFEDQFHNWVI